MMRGPVLLLALSAGFCFVVNAACARDADFFLGSWYVEDPKVCNGKPGEVEGLMTYTAKTLLGHEHACDIVKTTRKGGRVELTMNCSGEGEKYRQRDIVELVERNRLKVTGVVDRRTFSFTYRRCP